MASRIELINNVYNNALKDFRFTLYEASEGTKVLHHAPDGFFDKGATIWERNAKYGTVLRKTSKNELLFIKEGRDFIKNVMENTGIDAVITLTVERLNKTTYQYESYPFANKVDLSTYRISETGVSVQMMDTNFLEKVINRATTKVDLLKTVSSNGTTLPTFTNDEFTIPYTSVDNESTFVDGGGGFITEATHTVPIAVVTGGDFTEAQTPSTATTDIGTKNGSFYKSSVKNRVLNIDFDIQGEFIGTGAAFDPSVQVKVRHIDSSGITLNEYGIGSVSTTGVTSYSFSFQKSLAITVSTGDSLCLIGIISPTDKKFMYSTGDVDVKETYTGTPETTVKGYPFYEAFLRILQVITDEQNPLKSDYLGRTDTPLTTYASDGGGALGFITRGIYFRESDNVINTIAISLQDLFDSISSVLRIGMGYKEISGVNKMVIEDLDTFYDSTVILDISDRIRQEDIGKKVIPERYYKELVFGFNKYDYDNNSGLYEFNTKSNWTTAIQSVFNTLTKVSKIRGDGQGIRLLVNASSATDYDPSKDVKGDEDIFMVNVVRSGGKFVARTDEDFTSIGGSVYANSSFNIFYSPARMMRRWGQEIKAGLIKALNTYVRWQASDKNSTLTSQTTTETSVIDEDGDVIINDFDNPRFLPFEYEVEAPITTAELNTIDANPHGLVKLSSTQYGWINLLEPSTEDQMAKFTLLKCNLSVVTPT